MSDPELAASEPPDPGPDPGQPAPGQPADGQPSTEECSICLAELGVRRRRQLRECGHAFHASCISHWLRRDPHMACPLCRATALEALSDERVRLSTRMTKLLDVCGPPAETRGRYWLHGTVRQLMSSDAVAGSMRLDARRRQAINDLSFVALTCKVFVQMLEGWENSERERADR